MKSISVMIKPASSSCNLRCRYCFYIDETKNRSFVSHGVMSAETVAAVCQRIDEALNHQGTANIAFQGGEPTVAGLQWFTDFTACMDQYQNIHVNYALQTNATLIDESWIPLFRKYKFLIGISLDGYQANMDAFRRDVEGNSVFYKVLNTVELLQKEKIEVNILTVITRQLAEHASGLYQFYRSHHMDYVQLIPCLPPMDGTDDGMSLTPKMYRRFFRDFFKVWYKGTQKNHWMSVNLFDNLADLLCQIPPYQCGMLGKCTAQFVIEANGDVYPCDFYCVDEYLLGNLQTSSFAELFDSRTAKAFLRSSCEKEPCINCRFRNICHGGCRRQNACYLTDDACAYQEVLAEILPQLYTLTAPRE